MLANLRSLTHRIRRRILLHRRLLAALAVALAAYSAMAATSAPPPPTVPVWTAAREIPAGQHIRADDLAQVEYTPHSVPSDTVSDPRVVIGRVAARRLARGQPVDHSAVIGERWTRDQGGLAVVPVRISDAAVVSLVRPGDHVDLLATEVTATSGQASLLVRNARIVAVPNLASDPGDDVSQGPMTQLPGRLVLLGVPPEQVEEVTTATARQFLSISWSR